MLFYQTYSEEPLETLSDSYRTQERKFSSKPSRWFEDKNEAISHFLTARALAFERVVEVRRELGELQERLHFSISYNMEGDTYGIYDDYQYISLIVSGYEFMFKTD